jgi:hypothetical protein
MTMHFGRGIMAAVAAMALVAPMAAPARIAVMPAASPRPGRPTTRRNKKKDAGRAEAAAYRSRIRSGRGNKLGRRLARKAQLGMNGAF